MRFSVGIVGHGSRPHAHCFEDFARGLVSALRALGHDVVPTHDAKPGRLIMFGANNIIDVEGKMPADAIVYNSEQVGAAVDPKFHMQSHELFRRRVVWDYSRTNVAALQKIGIERPVLCPVGYIASMTKMQLAASEDIDVLFYGSINEHRRTVLDALDAAGLNVVRLFGVYGAERDAIIARSKLVLNLHFYEGAIFEIFRVSHLLANRRCVVTETGSGDAELEAFAARSTAYVPYERVVDECRRLVADRAARQARADLGHGEFAKIDLVESVRAAVEASS